MSPINKWGTKAEYTKLINFYKKGVIMKSLNYNDDFDDEITHTPVAESYYEDKWEGEGSHNTNMGYNPNQNKYTNEMSYPEVKCNSTYWSPVGAGFIFSMIGVFFCTLLFFIYRYKPAEHTKNFFDLMNTIVAILISSLFVFMWIVVILYIARICSVLNQVRTYGTHFKGVVLNYKIEESFWVAYQKHPLQACTILVDTPEGKKIIKYKRYFKGRPFSIDEVVDVIKYQDYYYVQKMR